MCVIIGGENEREGSRSRKKESIIVFNTSEMYMRIAVTISHPTTYMHIHPHYQATVSVATVSRGNH